MDYLTHQPAPPLADYVEYIWLLRDAPAHRREQIIASGTMELVINLHEDEFRIYRSATDERCARYGGAIVSGAYGGAGFVTDTLQHACVLGVHFRPGGAFPFLDVPGGVNSTTSTSISISFGAEPPSPISASGSAPPPPRGSAFGSCKTRSSRTCARRSMRTGRWRRRSARSNATTSADPSAFETSRCTSD
jgi:hypothetical protein